jgi:hypothetical protein
MQFKFKSSQQKHEVQTSGFQFGFILKIRDKIW